MNLASVLSLLKSVLPTKKIAAWILAVLTAVVALVMGLNSADVKASFCSSDTVVTLPKLTVGPATQVVAAPVVAPTVKK